MAERTAFTLRPAEEHEAGTIRALIHEVGINPTGLDWRRFVVAVDPDGKVLGCGQLKPHGEVVELASLAVVPGYQGQGIGRGLIEHLLASGPRPLYLMCRAPLGPLYEKFGFRALDVNGMPRYFKRIAQLAGWATTLTGAGDGLLIMKLQ